MNHAVTKRQSQDFVAVSEQAASTLNKYVSPNAVIGDAREDVTAFIRTKEFTPNTMLALRQLVSDIGNETVLFGELAKVPNDRVRNFRNDMYLVSEALRLMQKTHQPDIAASDWAIRRNEVNGLPDSSLRNNCRWSVRRSTRQIVERMP